MGKHQVACLINWCNNQSVPRCSSYSQWNNVLLTGAAAEVGPLVTFKTKFNVRLSSYSAYIWILDSKYSNFQLPRPIHACHRPKRHKWSMTENHKAFANVTTLRLSAAYQLHSCSLNPHKDLIALHRNLSWSQADERKQSRHATSIGFGLASLLRKDRILTKFRGKGKEREEDEDEKAGSIAVGIWRTNPGVQIDESISLPSLAQPVWEIDILGRYLAGLVWSNDGESRFTRRSCCHLTRHWSSRHGLVALGICAVSYHLRK